jgi:hypothetical protein
MPKLTPKDQKSESVSKHHAVTFSKTSNKPHGATQTVNVNVTIEEPKDDALSSCFSGLMKCFRKGS